MKVSIIAAMSDNNVLGRSSDNTIPWHIPEDFQHFKETTLNHPVIMGRNTWESLPKRPLPKRDNIVIYDMLGKGSVSPGDHYGAMSLTMALDGICKQHLQATEVFVIGGARLYQEAIHIADELIITHVDRTYSGDVLFPVIDRAIWEVRYQKSLTPRARVDYYKRR